MFKITAISHWQAHSESLRCISLAISKSATKERIWGPHHLRLPIETIMRGVRNCQRLVQCILQPDLASHPSRTLFSPTDLDLSCTPKWSCDKMHSVAEQPSSNRNSRNSSNEILINDGHDGRLTKNKLSRNSEVEIELFRHRPLHSRYFQGTPKVPMNISECKARQPINQSS